jgi:hypothetical protein
MARKNKGLPGRIRIWSQFVDIYINIFCKALSLLNVEIIEKLNENNISSYLNVPLNKACCSSGLAIFPPFWEGNISAVNNNEVKTNNTAKRPDFICKMINNSFTSPEDYTISLHIECKLIGSTTLNKYYINNGINRFDSLTHEYGKGANDGIMVGYIISSTKTTIQQEINSNLPNKLEQLNFKEKNKIEKITTHFTRENVKPLDFTLHHIWADFT